MKRITFLLAFVLSVSVYAQRNIEQELLLRTPNCESVAYNSARLAEQYFSKKDYDSVLVVISRWEDFCGPTEPLFRLKILTLIQKNSFTEDWMDENDLMNQVYLYEDREKYSKAPNAKIIYERYKIALGYIPLKSSFDDLTALWASMLLEDSDLAPAERAYCLLYANQIGEFWEMLKNKQLGGAMLQRLYDNEVARTREMVEGNLGFMTGVALPTGNLNQVIGIKPAFGFQVGMKANKIQYDLSILLRAGNAKNEYTVQYQGEPKVTDHYLGGYIGLDLGYELWRSGNREFDFLSGVAFDGFDAVEGDTGEDTEGKSINSLNLNLGLGYRIYGKRLNYFGIQAKYNFVNYKNNPGTDLGGNYISLIVTYNLFGNIQKRTMMDRLKM
ncbi:MAG: hypothetical protein JNL03_15940 [Prolixibacteraceae bacterium]|nr:hypothetical protein [Prolixibacteraceae bacterium]